MIDDTKEILGFGIGFFSIVFFIGFIVNTVLNDGCCMCGTVNNDCCPCPNSELIDLVESHAGHDASGAGSWLYMCEQYKKDTGDTRECFK